MDFRLHRGQSAALFKKGQLKRWYTRLSLDPKQKGADKKYLELKYHGNLIK